MEVVLSLILGFFAVVICFNIGYLFFYAVAGLFMPGPKRVVLKKLNKFAVFIPAYKGDEVILHTAEESLKQEYPPDLFDIIVIADSLQPSTIQQLKAMPLRVVEVVFENSTKGKALNAAIEAVKDTHYDYAIILDIDNLMAEKYLVALNERLQEGQQVIQTHRLAKNEDTNFSILDGISEEVNNHIFRKGHKAIGLSAALIGSGKAMMYPLFVEVMSNITAVGGFDKEMEILLISKRITIDYADDIKVYDEKVQLPEVFQNQRRRWMSAQFTFMRKFAFKGIVKSIATLNADYFDKSIQLILLPRVLVLGLTLLLGFISLFVDLPYGSVFKYSVLLLVISFIISVPLKYYNRRTINALTHLPLGFVLMFLNIFKLRGANKKFIHTPHSATKQGGATDNK